MNLLLDTHTFMWLDSNSAKLSPAARMAIADPANQVWFSVASIWEIQIKLSINKLQLQRPLEEILRHQKANIEELVMTSSHVLGLRQLPPIHKDPFDRMLAAQAIVEDLTLVTHDGIFGQYPVKVLW